MPKVFKGVGVLPVIMVFKAHAARVAVAPVETPQERGRQAWFHANTVLMSHLHHNIWTPFW